MTKREALREAQQRAHGYLANVINCHHRNPAAKLKGLVNLLRAGHTVGIADNAIDILIIDGCKASWCVLEKWQKRTK